MTQDAIPLPDALARLAAELARMEASGRALEDGVGDLVTAARGRASLALQDLDRLVQGLRDMAAVLDALRRHVPASAVPIAPLTGAARLERTRAVLLGRPDPQTAAQDDTFF